ncbi:MAG: ABC transporter transmembrane domain-containing protein [Rhodanobacter sp.]
MVTEHFKLSEAKKLFALMKGLRLRIAAGVLFVLASTGLSLTFPLIIGKVVDAAVNNAGFLAINSFAFILFAIFIARAAIGFAGGYLLDTSGEIIINGLRKGLLSRIIALDLRFFHSQRLGELASRLHSDTATIRNAVTETIVSSLNQLLTFCGALIVMLAMNWRLTLLILFLAPVSAILSARFGPRISSAARRVRDHSGDALAVASEGISGIHTVKLFSREPVLHEMYSESIDRALTASILSVRLSSLFGGALNFFSSIVTVGVFWYGGTQVSAGHLSAGQLIAFLFYSENITQSISVFSVIYGNIATALGSSARIFELMELSPTVVDPSENEASLRMPTSSSCQIEGVSFGYDPNHCILHDIDFRVDPGEVVGLVGTSGSGKTTLANLICRLFDPDSGRILLDGIDIKRLPIGVVREHVAMVSQDVFLFNTSIRENIRMARVDASDEDVENAARDACVDEFIVGLDEGLNTIVGERGVKLSGGQRQRISLARAFLRKSRLLVLDEATSAVDSLTEQRIQDAMIEKARKNSLSLIVIAHNLNTMRKTDRLVVIHGGQVVETGTFSTLASNNGMFEKLLTAGQRVDEEFMLNA